MSTEGKERAPLDDLLLKMENDLRAKKREIDTHLAPIELAVAAYRRALEANAATEYAATHHLPRPDLARLSPRIAAFNLMRTVEALREMPRAPEPSETEHVGSENVSAPPTLAASELSALVEVSDEGKRVLPLASALPKVVRACDTKKLVIVGALAGRKRPLPEPLDLATEWIDTSDGGAHPVGNLATRIRQGRVFGVIICEQAILHQHSEPVIAAARSSHVPVGFAGKGGGASIARALKTIEEQL